jgi:NADPH-dependent 2,4-dienoyl-CoA reductase/sulfur reductase-like enzyme
MKNLVIIGGSDAGISAALRAREYDPSIKPIIIESGNFPNFSICGLPYYISHEVTNWKNLAHRTKEEIEDKGIRLLLGHRATMIDTASKKVTVTDHHGQMIFLDYDKLVIGTGAISIKPAILGFDNPGVFLLRWVPDSIALDDFIDKRKPKNALIIGAGYIGMEMAEALVKRGLKITVVEFTESVMPTFDPDLGMMIKDTLAQNNISVYNNIAVESINPLDDKLIVRGTNNFEIVADMVFTSVGVTPNTSLDVLSGLEKGIKGAYKVNKKMEIGIPDIYAAGDCAETWHSLLKKYVYMPLGSIAHKQGRIAGENAAGGNREFAGSLGTQSVKVFDKVIARTGLNEKEAKDGIFDPVSADFETWDHKVYFPTARKLHIKVTADKMSGKIIGAQILGAYGKEVSKRIDIFATAIFHEMTIRNFNDYDLSYTPPLSSPWDPVQMAVQKLEKNPLLKK